MARRLGSMGSFAYAALGVISALLVNSFADLTEAGQLVIGIAVVLTVLALVIGWRMRQGKGAFLGMALIASICFSMLENILSGNIGGGLVIGGVILVAIVQGVRGALALRGETRFEDDDVEAFE